MDSMDNLSMAARSASPASAAPQVPARRPYKRRIHDARARTWDIVCLATQGVPHHEIAKKLDLPFMAVWSVLEAWGIVGKPAFYDFGEPQTAKNVLQLATLTGLSQDKIAELTGAPLTSARPNSAGGRINRYCQKRADRRIRPEQMKKIIVWRDGLLKFSGGDQSDSSGVRRQRRLDRSEFLKTFFPNLGQKYKLLLAILRDIRKHLRTRDPDGKSLQDYLCDRAGFATFLPWAPELMPFFEANVRRIEEPGDLAPIACEAIGARWAMSARIILAATFSSTGTIPPSEMRGLILGLLPSLAQPAERGRSSRKVRIAASVERTERFKVAQSVKQCLPRFAEAMKHLKELRRINPENPVLWRDALIRLRYSTEEIDSMLASKTTKAAAERYIAHMWKWKLQSVQSACQTFRNSLRLAN